MTLYVPKPGARSCAHGPAASDASIGYAEPLYSKRAEVVAGSLEPPEAPPPAPEEADAPPGIPEFWLNVLRANSVTASWVNHAPSAKKTAQAAFGSEDNLGLPSTLYALPRDPPKGLLGLYPVHSSEPCSLGPATGCHLNLEYTTRLLLCSASRLWQAAACNSSKFTEPCVCVCVCV